MFSILYSFHCFKTGKSAIVLALVVLYFTCWGSAHGTDWAYETGDLHAVWGNTGDDIFAVGKRGIVLHFDGGRWIPMDVGIGDCAIDLKFEDISGNSGTDVYAVGCHGPDDNWLWGCEPDSGTIFHYDGRRWTSSNLVGIQPLYGVWANSASDVFAVGDNGAILHFDGMAWAPMVSHTTVMLTGVWGTSGTNVFAVGDDGTILHFNGNDWSAMSSGISGPLNAVWGTSGTNVFAVGSGGTVLRYNGSEWLPTPDPGSGTSQTLTDVWGSSATNVFAVGNQGAIVHFDGSVWTGMPSNTTTDLKGLWGISESEIFAVGPGNHILRFNGSTWSIQSEASTEDLYDAWGTSENNVYVVGDNGTMLHYNGAGWRSMDSDTSDSLRAVWGPSVNSVYAVSLEGTIAHYDGSGWTTVYADPASRFVDIWGSSGSDIHVVGSKDVDSDTIGRILHFDGSTWTSQDFEGYPTILGVWGNSSSDVFATTYYDYRDGSKGVILHFDGSSWLGTIIGDKHWLKGIWGSAADDVHAVGHIWTSSGPTYFDNFHYDGSTWHSAPTDTPYVGSIELHSVSGRSKNDLFAVGPIGGGVAAGYAILRNTGGAWWLDRYNPYWHPLYGVWAGAGGHVFAVGRDGVILRLVPEGPPPAPGSLWARTYGGEGIDKAHAVAPTSDGGSIVAGQTDSIGAGGSDVWVVKLDEEGDVSWHRTYGGANDDHASSVVQTVDGGYILAGSTTSFGAGASDAWIVKLDSEGNLEWENAYGGPDEDSASAILETGSCAEGYAYAVLGTTRYSQEERDGWVMKLDTAGGVAWRKTYPMDGGGDLVSLARGKGYGYFVSGKTNHYYGDGFSDFLVLRLDDAGDVLWGKNFGLCSILTPQGCNINIEKPASLCVAEDGGPLLVGRSSPSHGSPFVWGVKLDALGGVEWQYTYFGDVEISSVRQTRDLGYIVGGRRKEYDLYTTREYTDGWLMRLDQDGTNEWTGLYRGFDRTDQEAISSVHPTADGGYVASGWTTSLTPGEADFWVLRLDEAGLIPECAAMTTWYSGLSEETAEQGASISITAVETDTIVSPSNAIGTVTEVITQDTCLSGVSDLIDLPRTGQTTAYHTGDDGHIRAGTPWPDPRFVDNGDGSITDDLTGLVWLKGGDCLGGILPWKDALDSVADFNVNPANFSCLDYDAADSRNDWRMPNMNELASLTNAQLEDSAAWLNGKGFAQVIPDSYWSSTTFSGHLLQKWCVSMMNGATSNIYQTNHRRVWAVRGGQKDYWDPNYPANVWKTGQTVSYYPGDDGDHEMGVFWPTPRFLDNEDGTVTDNLTGLVWLQDTLCFEPPTHTGITDWENALDTVTDFEENPGSYACAGYDVDHHQAGWRLPNRTELLSLTDWTRWRPALTAGHPFLNVDITTVYWTSTTHPSEPASPQAWVAYPMAKGGLGVMLKNHGQPTVWPVRGEIHDNALRDADFDADGDVDGRDISILAAAFGSHLSDLNFDPRTDVIMDGVIDQADLQAFTPHLGRADCPCQ